MSKSTKTTTENKPPEWSKPLFTRSAEEGLKLFDAGAGGNTFLGSTVAPLSNTTMAGVNQLAQAGQGWNTAGTRGLFQGVGAASVSDPTVNRLNSLAGSINPGSVNTSRIQGGQTDVSGITGGRTDTTGITGGQTDISGVVGQNVGTDDFRGILDRAQAPTSAAANLQQYASGANLSGEGNPFFRQRLEGDLADTAAQVRSLMSGSGRLGSGAETRTLVDRLGQLRLEGLENDFNREQANQFNAVGMIDAANQNALGMQLGAASGIAGVNTGNADRSLQAGLARAGFSAGDLDRKLQAATTRVGFGAADLDRNLQAGLGRAGFSAGDLDRGLSAATSRAGFEAGNFDRDLQGQQLQGNLLAQAGQFRGAGLDRGLAATNAMAGLDQRNFENRLAGAGATLQAGGIMDDQAQKLLSDEVAKFYALDNEDWTRLGMLQAAAAGSAGNYGTQVSTQRQPINPWNAIGAMFTGKSDIRLKENIVAVGEANGIRVWEWNYIGQPDRWRGVIAQDLPLGSEAIVMEDDGYFAVDYGKIGFMMERAA